MANEAGDIIYGKGTNVQVADDQGTLHRATLVAPAPGEIVFNDPDTTSPNVMVADDEGNLHRATLVAAIGGFGGSDAHNKGWFADEAALVEAYPTGEDGDYAFLGSTDTIWVWDSDSNTWVDTDRKGQVTSVNNATGDVTVQETLVNQSNIKSVNGNSLLGSGNLEIAAHLEYPSSWPTTSSSTTKAFCDVVAADTTAVVGKMYLGEARWSDLPGSMANGEVVVEIMDGTTSSNKVIVLTLTSGNLSPYMWKYTYWNGGSNVSGWIGFQPELPSQSGNSGKFLKTDGSSLSWDNALVNNSIGTESLSVLGGRTGSQRSTSVGYAAAANGLRSLSLGWAATVGYSANYGVAIGYNTYANKPYAIQLGTDATRTAGGYSTVNDDANTFKVANENGNFEIMSANGTIPADRLVASINKYSTMPTAASTTEGWIVQYIGTTDLTYTHGYIYECVSDGAASPTYSWTRVDVQPTPSGLPSQAGHSGEFLTTDGTDASWAAPVVATFRVWGANE